MAEAFRKDASLNELAERANVAQFFSISPIAKAQEFSRVAGYPANYVFENHRRAVGELLRRSADMSVNVRSFLPEDPRSKEFIYGLRSVDDVCAAIARLLDGGLFVIINETIDIHDGGVSGVVQGGVIEFAPDDTPRCVEKPGVASLPLSMGTRMLNTVYRGNFDLNLGRNNRFEFSLHPKRCGWKQTHILGWELEAVGKSAIKPTLAWPNRFSTLVGDKVYGLLMAWLVGLPVPRTDVINRRIAPFHFGKSTGSQESWIRTAPREQVPGKYTTQHGWIDPFALIAREDPSGNVISSILAQQAIPAAYSGALIVGGDEIPVIEGAEGEGEEFMQGTKTPGALPETIKSDVLDVFSVASRKLGPVRFEWVHDGVKAWIVQLHRGATDSTRNTLVPGAADRWREFEVSRGLENLRTELAAMSSGDGIVLRGQVGLTSHIADVVRKAGRPARIQA